MNIAGLTAHSKGLIWTFRINAISRNNWCWSKTCYWHLDDSATVLLAVLYFCDISLFNFKVALLYHILVEYFTELNFYKAFWQCGLKILNGAQFSGLRKLLLCNGLIQKCQMTAHLLLQRVTPDRLFFEPPPQQDCSLIQLFRDFYYFLEFVLFKGLVRT